ncbi:MAG: hypothetical protein EHM43_09500 [Ignavibacteriae bacterium]|nr:MAG: hypothetical protein EHM43_09500 [Ignavibacteriota bacterium]
MRLPVVQKQAAEWLKARESSFDRDSVLTPLLKEFVEEALDGELDAHLESESEQSACPNRRNGRKTKSVNTGLGKDPIKAPRDRAGGVVRDIQSNISCNG